jgi:putative transposase
MREKFEKLTDSQWEVMAEFLPVQRKRKIELRSVVDAIRWLNETGCQWRNLPETYPAWTAVYYYFYVWKHDGTLEFLNIGMNVLERITQDKFATPSLVCVDSQSVKVSSLIKEDKGVDGNKKVNGRKRQVLVDTLGLVWAVFVHAANGSDSVWGSKLLERIAGVCERLEKILVDKGYEGQFIELASQLLGVEAEISSKPPSEKGFVPVKWRWISEQTFGCFNFYRRLSKDYEKTAESSEAWILWANCQRIILRW